LVQKIFPKF